MKKVLFFFLSLAMVSVAALSPLAAHADSTPGDVIVTLGADLTEAQKDSILKEMNVDPNNVEIIKVTNAEEHKYLDKYMPKAQIGTRAISSTKITIGKKGSGLSVSTNNINYVSDDMYLNALATAGVKDASVYVTAPFEVSGTAGLTGLIKAYEVSTGDVIPEKQKQVANEEMVTTANLAKKADIGKDKAAGLMTSIKEKMAKADPQNKQDIEKIVRDSANELNINLNDQDIQKLVNLFDKMKDLNINWNSVGDQLQKAKDKLSDLANSDEAKGFLSKVFSAIGSFIKAVMDAIASLFS
ncbi:DUF1002 domain-containing protein [Scopulibacillus darangshiensis]|uniref:DUF1002 domain-containing protein n=1 Tax=Scopulibacillus darangshiensis TaxID=442528 RepID=UPI0010502C8D|nr:DUF1002 domain-containing protein [Scopulibacillus darangshiensis]